MGKFSKLLDYKIYSNWKMVSKMSAWVNCKMLSLPHTSCKTSRP